MPDWEELKRLAIEEVAATLAALPAPLQARAATLPVIFEPAPNDDLITDGIEADSLGLFIGTSFVDEDQALSPVPPQIFLYLANLWDFAEHDLHAYRAEVHTTYLHELGHYLGLDEDDLADRGLD